MPPYCEVPNMQQEALEPLRTPATCWRGSCTVSRSKYRMYLSFAASSALFWLLLLPHPSTLFLVCNPLLLFPCFTFCYHGPLLNTFFAFSPFFKFFFLPTSPFLLWQSLPTQVLVRCHLGSWGDAPAYSSVLLGLEISHVAERSNSSIRQSLILWLLQDAKDMSSAG